MRAQIRCASQLRNRENDFGFFPGSRPGGRHTAHVGTIPLLFRNVLPRQGAGGVACDRRVAHATTERVPKACGMARGQRAGAGGGGRKGGNKRRDGCDSDAVLCPPRHRLLFLFALAAGQLGGGTGVVFFAAFATVLKREPIAPVTLPPTPAARLMCFGNSHAGLSCWRSASLKWLQLHLSRSYLGGKGRQSDQAGRERGTAPISPHAKASIINIIHETRHITA